MSKKKIKKESPLLHIYNRGNRKQNICEEFEDYVFLHNLIRKTFKRKSFDLLSFCLMPNHFHLLTKKQGPNTFGKAMQIIGGGYTKYFNVKYSLSGHLFQGTYNYKFITSSHQLKTLIKYIENNVNDINFPVKYPFHFLNTTLVDYHMLILKEAFYKTGIP